MESSSNSIRLPGLAAMYKLVALARGALTVVGLAVVLAALLGASLPSQREALLRQFGDPLAPWQDQDGRPGSVTAGTIQPGTESPVQREQRAVAEFIAKRYRVAHDAVAGFVATAYRAGGESKVDPLLILAVMAIESRYNPVAESHMGAKGLMQVIPKFHLEKLVEHGGEATVLDPEVNIQVGAQILREYLRRFGETETALQMYAGAFDEPNSIYAGKVLAEKARLDQVRVRTARNAS